MIPAGTPDLLTTNRTQRTIAEVQRNFTRASEELTSGRKSDVVEATGGDPARLYGVERGLAAAEQRRVAIDIAISRSGTTQAALERVQNNVSSIGVSLLAAVERPDFASADRIAAGARSAFEDTVAALNTRFGERTLFSGAITDGPALATGEEILTQILAATAGATDAAAVVAAVDLYFADPAGFAATGYLGSTADAPPAEVDEGLRVDHAVRADRAELVAGLRALALGVVAAESGFAGATIGERLNLMRESGASGVAAVEDVVNLRAELGVSEERLDIAKTRVSAETAFLERAKNALIAKDQFEAAQEFTALETQLSLIFELTGRLSGLNLANFLR